MSRPLTGALIRVAVPAEGQPATDFIGWADIEDNGHGLVELVVIDGSTSHYRDGERVLVERDIAEAGEFIRQPGTEQP